MSYVTSQISEMESRSHRNVMFMCIIFITYIFIHERTFKWETFTPGYIRFAFIAVFLYFVSYKATIFDCVVLVI